MSHLVKIGSVVKSVSEWCREYKMEQSTVSRRIRSGWDPVQAITTPARRWHKPAPKTIGNIRRWVWESMVQRCYWKLHKSYHRYGGRGIEVWSEWRYSWERFATDLIAEIGPRPAGHQIDRIDNDRGYEPGNLRWATPKKNGNNRSNNIRITHNGETLTASQWAERVDGLTTSAIGRRIALGWSAADAVTKPPQEPAEELEICGEKMPIAEWAKRTGRNKATIRSRLRAGMSPNEAVFGEPSRRFDGLCPRCKERPLAAVGGFCSPCRRTYKAEWRAKRKAEGLRVT